VCAVSSCRVLVVDERRLLASGLARALESHAEMVEVQVLQDLSSLPVALTGGWDVVATSENYAGHVLRLAPPLTRVLAVVQHADVALLARLLRQGAAGVCTSDDLPEDVAAAVAQVASGEMRLPGYLVHDVLNELQRLRRRAQDAGEVLTKLTERERDVLAGLGQGRGRAEIGRDLGLSPHTVRTHVQHLLRKLELHSQLEAAAFARELVAAISPAPRIAEQGSVVIDLHDHKDRRGTGART
jgi:DNA-binding NarL/FixJ family response regulator